MVVSVIAPKRLETSGCRKYQAEPRYLGGGDYVSPDLTSEQSEIFTVGVRELSGSDAKVKFVGVHPP